MIKDRWTIRKGVKDVKNNELFLYGRLKPSSCAKAYCKYHKCYLEAKDIKEKGCNRKNCIYRLETIDEVNEFLKEDI